MMMMDKLLRKCQGLEMTERKTTDRILSSKFPELIRVLVLPHLQDVTDIIICFSPNRSTRRFRCTKMGEFGRNVTRKYDSVTNHQQSNTHTHAEVRPGYYVWGA